MQPSQTLAQKDNIFNVDPRVVHAGYPNTKGAGASSRSGKSGLHRDTLTQRYRNSWLSCHTPVDAEEAEGEGYEFVASLGHPFSHLPL